MSNRFSNTLVLASRVLPWIIVVTLIVTATPWCYHFFADRSEPNRFVLYSSVIKDFAILEHTEGGVSYSDAHGGSYTEAEFDSILVTFHYRQLMSEGRLPDSLNGVAVSPQFFQRESFTFRSAPSEVNRPAVPLYFLLESMSGRVDLSMPSDVFRLTHSGIEFVDMGSNSLNKEKSRIFTEAMLKKGFKFPAKVASGNGTNRKDYDNGYLLTDSDGALYNLKMQRGRPYFRKIETPQGLDISHIFVTEFRNHRSLAFLIDSEGYFYVLEAGTYRIVKTALPQVDPTQTNISIIGNAFDWTVTYRTPTARHIYAIDAATLQLIAEY